MKTPMDKTAVLAVLGVAVFELGREFREACPKTADLRSSDDAPHMLQHLVDGELHVGILAGGVALAAWWLTDSPVIPLIIVGTYVGLVAYHHSLLGAPSVPDYR